jgi:tRNA1Val (adenine37-N6)-methyltransferase
VTAETVDLLSRTLRLIQHRHGHRAASDDILLAWAAWRAQPNAGRILELGCGKGTVALLLLRRLPYAVVTGMEAHPSHQMLAVRNGRLNGLSDRFRPILGDFRCAELLEGQPPFELVCGAPPFMPLGSGVMPVDAGRAAGRFELRGGVEDYARAAARHLAPGGRLVLLMDGQPGDRASKAITEAGLHLRRHLAVLPFPAQRPKYRIFEAAHEPRSFLEEEICLRTAAKDSGWSASYQEIRSALDLPESKFITRVTLPPG